MLIKNLLSQDLYDSLPKTLYKYRSWSDDYHKEILLGQIVFMAQATSFEDSKDCRLQKRYDLLSERDMLEKYIEISKQINKLYSRQQHRKFARDQVKKSPLKNIEATKQLQNEQFRVFDKKLGVLSLTANPRIWEMWNKYSDDHHGFCVGFDSNKIWKFLDGGGEVSYFDDLPDIFPFDNYDVEIEKKNFYKESKWAFEEEYRMLKYYRTEASIEDRKITLPKDCYKEIVFGSKMTEIQKKEIICQCLNLDLKVEFFAVSNVADGEILINKII
jgi:hypothetical protein